MKFWGRRDLTEREEGVVSLKEKNPPRSGGYHKYAPSHVLAFGS